MINFNNKNNRKFLSEVLILVVILMIAAKLHPMLLSLL